MNYILECELEEDGRWLAEVLELPGVLAYGVSKEEAMAKAEALALRVIAERLEYEHCKLFAHRSACRRQSSPLPSASAWVRYAIGNAAIGSLKGLRGCCCK